MSELAGKLEEKKSSKIKRLFEWVGGGMAVAQAAELSYVDHDQNTGDEPKVSGFIISEPIRTPAELTDHLAIEETRQIIREM